jgi:hypothetical protein
MAIKLRARSETNQTLKQNGKKFDQKILIQAG